MRKTPASSMTTSQNSRSVRSIRLVYAVLLAIVAGVVGRAQSPVAPAIVLQLFDNNGIPASGFKLCSYSAGSSSPLGTYSDSGLTILNPNPLVLNTAGRPSVSNAEVGVYLLAQNYKFVLLSGGDTTCSTGVQIWSRDNVPAVSLLTTAAKLGTGTPSTTTFLRGDLAWATPSGADFGTCDLRLTLTSGAPYTTGDVTAATSVYVTPLRGGRCSFYDGSAAWTALTNSEVTISVPATTTTIYDVWCRNNAGSMACDTTAWTNDTTRATALTTQNAVYEKTGDTTRRYLGSFRTTGVSGQTEDSDRKRYVWSYYDRVPRRLRRFESTANWTYTTNTIRQANASTTNQVEAVIGVAEVVVDVGLLVAGVANTNAASGAIGIGEDTTTAFSGQSANFTLQASSVQITPFTRYVARPAVGFHYYAWNEVSTAAGTTTWIGVSAPNAQSGLDGWVQ